MLRICSFDYRLNLGSLDFSKKELLLKSVGCVSVKDVVSFPKPAFVYKESVGTALIPVERQGGYKTKVVVKYDTKDLIAVKGRDNSIDDKQEVGFEKGEVSKMIEICIKNYMFFLL